MNNRCIRSRGRRRALVAIAALGAARPAFLFAQPAQGVRRIGYLGEATADSDQARAFKRQIVEWLQQLGWQEGRNLAIEWRYAEGRLERADNLAEDLLRSNVELVMAAGAPVTLALKKASTTVPIVMLNVPEPVQTGLVDSIERPGGNVTGSAGSVAIAMKRLIPVAGEAVPGMKRLAVLTDLAVPHGRLAADRWQAAAASSGLAVEILSASKPDEVLPGLERIVTTRPDAVHVVPTPAVTSRGREVGRFLVERRLLGFTNYRPYVESGFVVFAVGSDVNHNVERGVGYVDRILRGAKPAELPILMPIKFDLVVNAEVARAIGYQMPPALLARAVKVIE